MHASLLLSAPSASHDPISWPLSKIILSDKCASAYSLIGLQEILKRARELSRICHPDSVAIGIQNDQALKCVDRLSGFDEMEPLDIQVFQSLCCSNTL